MDMSKERRLISPFFHADILLFVTQTFKPFAEYDDFLQKMTKSNILFIGYCFYIFNLIILIRSPPGILNYLALLHGPSNFNYALFLLIESNKTLFRHLDNHSHYFHFYSSEKDQFLFLLMSYPILPSLL